MISHSHHRHRRRPTPLPRSHLLLPIIILLSLLAFGCLSHPIHAQELEALSPISSPSSSPSSDAPPLSSPSSSLSSDVDVRLLAELDVLIELQQRKVQLLTKLQQQQQQQQQQPLHTPSPAPSSPPSPDPSSSPSFPIPLHRSHPSSSSPSTSSSFSVTQFLSRASVFLVAIGATVIYQNFARKGKPLFGSGRRAASVDAREFERLERDLRMRRLQQTRAADPVHAGLHRRRVHSPARDGAVASTVYADDDEWREDAAPLDEGAGDFWDARETDHRTYTGLLGKEDAKDASEGEEEAEDDPSTAEGAQPAGALGPADGVSDDEYDEDDEDEW